MSTVLQVVGASFLAGVFFTLGAMLTCAILKWAPVRVTLVTQRYYTNDE